MKWRGRRSSSNVERRSSAGGGGMRTAGGIGGFGLIIVIVLTLIMGGNPLDALNSGITPGGGSSQEQSGTYTPRNEEEAEIEEFLSVVLADTEDVWNEIFEQHGATYREPKMVLYQDTVNSGCGFASKQMGPFYCGADETVYIDVSFTNQLRDQFGAGGDFPMAYVLAHEVGHHVQLLTGALQEVQGLRGRVPDVQYNNEMVKLELQADYYAGVFAHYVGQKGYLEQGDIQEGLKAAEGVGDDRIIEMQGGTANPDNFQHGSSEQRMRWFERGYQYGDLENGNTFQVEDAKDL